MKNKQERRVLLVATAGGHVTEMGELYDAFKSYNTSTFLYAGTSSGTEWPNLFMFRNFAAKPFVILIEFFRILFLVLKIRPHVVVSTGAELAIPVFYLCKIFCRSRLVYVECSAQVVSPSLTGRIVYPITDLFLVQWEALLSVYGKKAKYVGGLI